MVPGKYDKVVYLLKTLPLKVQNGQEWDLIICRHIYFKKRKTKKMK